MGRDMERLMQIIAGQLYPWMGDRDLPLSGREGARKRRPAVPQSCLFFPLDFPNNRVPPHLSAD